MRHTILLSLVLAALLLGGSVGAQECGNINGQGIIDLADMSMLYGYLMSNEPALMSSMDIDDWIGVSLGDAIEFTDYIAMSPHSKDSFDCDPQYIYSFAPSPNDTIFIPRMLNVPAGLTKIILPVKVSLQPGAGGVMFLLRDGAGQAGFRILSAVDETVYGTWGNFGLRFYGPMPFTWTFIVARSRSGEYLAGNHTYFSLVCEGEGTGGSIVPELNDIDALIRTSVERNGDLVVPTVVYYDYELPPDTLKFTPTSLAFTSQAGREKNDTLTVNFTSSGSNITFDLTASEPWLTPVGTTFTTPATVKVTVNAAMLAMGLYPGELTLTNASSGLGTVVPQAAVPVAVTVGPPVTYPPGDVSCDGLLDLVDLSIIIARLMGDRGPIEPCY